jgi:hypothetical protein
MSDQSPDQTLPLGTTKDTAKLHRNIQRLCWVLLIGLVLEGAFILPFTLIWYGFPTLSIREICTELERAQYADDGRECTFEALGAPFLRRRAGELRTEGAQRRGPAARASLRPPRLPRARRHPPRARAAGQRRRRLRSPWPVTVDTLTAPARPDMT